MSDNWYALRIKPHKERTVVQQLQSREVTHYFPTIKVKPVNPRSATQKPYFPGYLFVKANLDQLGKNAFSWIPGTLGLVTYGETAAVVPEMLIIELRQKLSQINTTEPVKPTFKKGEKVQVTAGPFAGFEGVFDTRLAGSERVQILLAILSNHPHAVRLDEDIIKKS